MGTGIVCLVMALVFLPAAAQVHPSPQTDGHLSLPKVLLYIQDGLNKIGKRDFQVFEPNQTLHVASETSDVFARADRCGIEYHSKYSINGNMLNNNSSWISFRDVQTLTVLTAVQDFRQINPAFTGNVRPEVFFLRVQEKGTDVHRSPEFIFSDRATAEGMKRAMLQAAALCTQMKQ